MGKRVDYTFATISPLLYLGHKRLAASARRDGASGLTDEAIGRQVFGAPTYVYRDELSWGQDRLDFLDRALAK
jgi:2-hydroxychromene-2-carboxylate isomerase